MKNKTQERRRKKGLCPYCGNQPLPNKVKCKDCTRKYVKYKKTSISKMTEDMCKTCGGKRDDNYKTCSRCRNRIKQWRESNIEEGKCHKCGRKPIPNANKCLTCYLKETSQQTFGTRSKYKELLELFELQSGVCPYSGKQLTLGIDTSIDHRTAKSKGGEDHISNLQWTHKMVNQMKWDSDEHDFLEMVNHIASYRKWPPKYSI